jgi:hypothetical protein
MRVGRCATKVRDGIPRGLIEPSSTLHLLWPYRSSNRADRRVAQRRCVPRRLRSPPLKAAPMGLGQSKTLTVSLKGITETQAAQHSRIAHDHPLSRAEPSGPQFLYGDCTVRLPRTIRNTAKVRFKKVKIFKSLSPPGDPLRFGFRGQGYEKRQPRHVRV